MEVDLVRKRIALSIKQAQEMPEKKRNISGRPESKKTEPSSGSMAEALNALKKKFGN
jgi:predicted RNA-binding protein with RPS1 domain